MKHTRKRTCIVTVIAVLAIGVAAHRADAGGSINIKQNLSATGVDPDASGQIQAQISRPKSGMRAKLDLKGRRLDANATYTVLMNGVPIGTLTTTPGGNGRARFTSQPRRKDQLLGVDPRGMQIEVRNANGDGVLETNVPDTGMDPTHVPCCLPQNDANEPPECEDLTAEACTAAGGATSSAASCLPNPCQGATPPPPQDDIVCCTPEGDGVTAEGDGVTDNGAECEMRSTASCSEHNGINLGAGSCDPNPCVSTTPSNPDTVQCCVTDGEETECKHRTAELCATQGGTDMGPGSCSPNPCASQTPADQVRCCLAKDSGGTECEERTAAQCAAQGGTSAGSGTCDASACGTTPPPSGGNQIRCCLPHGGRDNNGPECESRTAEECAAQGGTDMGPGSCEPNPCG